MDEFFLLDQLEVGLAARYERIQSACLEIDLDQLGLESGEKSLVNHFGLEQRIFPLKHIEEYL